MNDLPNIEKLTFKHLFGLLTIKQVITFLSSLVLLIGSVFTVGLNFERSSHIKKTQEVESQLRDLKIKNEDNDTHIQFLRAKEKFLELTSVILFNSAMLDYDLGGGRDKRYYSHLLLDIEEFENRLEDYYIYVEEITRTRGKNKPIAYYHASRAGPSTLEFWADKTNWVVIPVPHHIRYRILRR